MYLRTCADWPDGHTTGFRSLPQGPKARRPRYSVSKGSSRGSWRVTFDSLWSAVAFMRADAIDMDGNTYTEDLQQVSLDGKMSAHAANVAIVADSLRLVVRGAGLRTTTMRSSVLQGLSRTWSRSSRESEFRSRLS